MTLAVITTSPLLNALLFLLVCGVLIWLFVWLINASPLPPPFKQILVWVLYLIGVIILADFLLGLVGRPFLNL